MVTGFAAGCATRATNNLPEPRVALLVTIPDGADVELDCRGEVRHTVTPVKLAVPPDGDACSLTLSKVGYETKRVRFDGSFVMATGEPLRVDESHELDVARVTSPLDVLLMPLQRWSDRMQNALQRKVIADYRITVKLQR